MVLCRVKEHGGGWLVDRWRLFSRSSCGAVPIGAGASAGAGGSGGFTRWRAWSFVRSWFVQIGGAWLVGVAGQRGHRDEIAHVGAPVRITWGTCSTCDMMMLLVLLTRPTLRRRAWYAPYRGVFRYRAGGLLLHPVGTRAQDGTGVPAAAPRRDLKHGTQSWNIGHVMAWRVRG